MRNNPHIIISVFCVAATFYSISCAGDFILEMLVGCPVEEIRDTALDQFYLLSQTPPTTTTTHGGEGEEPPPSPHHYMLHTLLRARLPFWVQSSSTRHASQRLLRQCKQYFELRCRLLLNLTGNA
jgi:ubiquitin carboxyl-terminal hydrolase 9/24